MLKMLKRILRVPYAKIYLNDTRVSKAFLKRALNKYGFCYEIKEIHFDHPTKKAEIFTKNYLNQE